MTEGVMPSNAVFLPAAPESRLIDAEYIRSFLNGFCSRQHPPDMFLFDFLKGDSVAESCDGITGQEVFSANKRGKRLVTFQRGPLYLPVVRVKEEFQSESH